MSSDVSCLPGIGPAYQKRLAKLGIFTIKDLVSHYPSRYLDFSQTVNISQLKPQKSNCFKAKITSPISFYSKSGKYITQALAHDSSGQINLVWFNSPYIKNALRLNTDYIIAGKPSFFSRKLAIFSPQIEVFSHHNNLHTQGFVPHYPLTKGISSKWLRGKINLALKKIKPEKDLSIDILKKLGLPSNLESLANIHFPPNLKAQDLADKRLSFNQHLKINLQNLRELAQKPPAVKITIDRRLQQKSLNKLPFQLTPDQKKALKDVYNDIHSATPSRRLIHGDTGSGKTAILILLANQCLNSQYSFALLTPTQILAEQHKATFKKMSLFPQSIQLITAASKRQVKDRPTLYIGTHALLNYLPQKLKTPIAVLAIDEQHKFGVQQRQALTEREPSPHILNLSATPIPRTVALGLFGEVQISTIKQKPRNRKPPKTWLMDKDRLLKGYTWLAQKLQQGNKIFVVCPNIKSSPPISSVQDTLPVYQQKFGRKYKVYSLHGKTPLIQRQKILKQFRQDQPAILVSTPLIEVGIDIPKANVIIIHSADRFGLAQLHQLRGRVGRGVGQSYCLLIPSNSEQIKLDRLKLLTQYSSGLKLAKLDLQLRGAGEMFGLKQHGRLPVRLKHFWDRDLFRQAKHLALTHDHLQGASL